MISCLVALFMTWGFMSSWVLLRANLIYSGPSRIIFFCLIQNHFRIKVQEEKVVQACGPGVSRDSIYHPWSWHPPHICILRHYFLHITDYAYISVFAIKDSDNIIITSSFMIESTTMFYRRKEGSFLSFFIQSVQCPIYSHFSIIGNYFYPGFIYPHIHIYVQIYLCNQRDSKD